MDFADQRPPAIPIIDFSAAGNHFFRCKAIITCASLLAMFNNVWNTVFRMAVWKVVPVYGISHPLQGYDRY